MHYYQNNPKIWVSIMKEIRVCFMTCQAFKRDNFLNLQHTHSGIERPPPPPPSPRGLTIWTSKAQGGDSSMKMPGRVCLGSENVPILKDTLCKKNIPILKDSSAHLIPMLWCNIRLKFTKVIHNLLSFVYFGIFYIDCNSFSPFLYTELNINSYPH